MGKMLIYTMVLLFFIELGLFFTGEETTGTLIFNALMAPKSAFWTVLITTVFVVVVTVGSLAIITPTFLYQVNQWALFAGFSLVAVYWVAVFVDVWQFINSQLLDVGTGFAGIIASVVCAPLILVYLISLLEWSRFNQ